MSRITRRTFCGRLAGGAAAVLTPNSVARMVRAAPAVVLPRPNIPLGVSSGDVAGGRGVVWSKCDRAGRMMVEWDTTDALRDARIVRGPAAMEDSDFTAKVELTDLPPGQRVFYRVTFEDLSSPAVRSEPAVGTFRTPPGGKSDVLFAFSGDTCGQGFGINPDWGGMKVYETIRRLEPHFFIHSGDYVYADNAMPERMLLDDGTVWKNFLTDAKRKVAETLDEFRGNYAYNLHDVNVRRFNAEVSQFVQWDDHETANNWYPGEILTDRGDDARYQNVKSCSLLAARGARAFREYTPVSFDPADPDRVFRSFAWGPSLELFILDQRSYRGPNSANDQKEQSGATAFLGRRQLEWLKKKLAASKATWKIICSDMPVGLIVPDGTATERGIQEGLANHNGPPVGRELETAELLAFMKRQNVKNAVWLTADVHYAAAHYYDPGRARFKDFDPFWEFVAGPLHAATYGPNPLDDTFGPEVRFQSRKPGAKQGRPPTEGQQYFGTAKLDGKSETLTVSLYNLAGEKLYAVDLTPR